MALTWQVKWSVAHVYGIFFHMFIWEPVHSSQFVERRPLQNKIFKVTGWQFRLSHSEQTKQIALIPVEPVSHNGTLSIGSFAFSSQPNPAQSRCFLLLKHLLLWLVRSYSYHTKTLQMVGYQDLEICRSSELKSERSSFLATLDILHNGFSWLKSKLAQEKGTIQSNKIHKIKQFECVHF